MSDTSKREELIRVASKRLYFDHSTDKIAETAPEIMALCEQFAEVTLAVFEQAHTPSDDEREAMAQIVKDVSVKWGGPSMVEFADTPPIRKHYATADAILAAGFRRSEVPEPSADKREALCDQCGEVFSEHSCRPILSCIHLPEPPADLCEWCDMSARGNALHPGHDRPRRSCGEQYHGEDFEPDVEPQGEPTDARQAAARAIFEGYVGRAEGFDKPAFSYDREKAEHVADRALRAAGIGQEEKR